MSRVERIEFSQDALDALDSLTPNELFDVEDILLTICRVAHGRPRAMGVFLGVVHTQAQIIDREMREQKQEQERSSVPHLKLV